MRGRTNEKEAKIAIILLILIKGFLTKGSPQNPHINSPDLDFL